MKTAAKVFIILGMIAGCYAILPLVFGFIALSKMKKNQMTTGWKVVTLLFVSLIGGILLFCIPEETAAPVAAPVNNNTDTQA